MTSAEAISRFGNRRSGLSALQAQCGISGSRIAGATRVLPLLLLLMLPAVAQAQFNYTIDNGAVTITGYTGPGGAVTIPSTISGLPVTSIGDEAFSWCGSLTSVTIPSSVTSIGDFAFEGCTSLSAITVHELNSVYSSAAGVLFNKSKTLLIQCPGGKAGSYTIPDSVSRIKFWAFANCRSLTSVTIPNSVTSIERDAFVSSGLTSVTIPSSVTNIEGFAFAACTSLSAITVDELNSGYSSAAGVLFNKSKTLLIQCPGAKAGSYAIPDSVGSIGGGAFHSCGNLTSVTIPNFVTSIGNSAFSYCDSLIWVAIGNGVTSIGEYAFLSCAQLTGVTIPGSVARIGDYAFSGCTSLSSVAIPSGVTCIGEHAFDSCSRLTGVTIPNTVTNIGSHAFYQCGSLTNATIGSKVTSIGDYAFAYCFSLTNATIPGSVTNIGSQAFYECSRLTAINVSALNPVYSSVGGVLFNKSLTTLIQCPCGKTGAYTIPSSVTTIGDWAFDLCALTSVTIPNSVTSIGWYAFFYSSLTSVTIPGSVTTIGRYAFYACASLTNVTILDGVTTIGWYAFASTCLRNLTIPDSVTEIHPHAFENCMWLTNVIMRRGGSIIGDYAFAYCDRLNGIYCQGNAPWVGWYGFYWDRATVYYLPGTTGWGVTLGDLPTALWPVQDWSYTPDGHGGITITGYTGSGGEVTIPSTIWGLPVTSIGWRALYGRTSLTKVTIGNSLTSIGIEAFRYCTSLTNVTIGNNATTIYLQAFADCTSLRVVYFKGNAPGLDAYVFAGDNIATVYYQTGTTGWGTTFGGRPVLPCPAQGPLNYTANSSTITIMGYTGSGGAVTIPGTIAGLPVASIGDAAFENSSGLTSIAIPNSVTNIGNQAFALCTNLAGVTMGSNITRIGVSAFADCTRLTSVTIPDGVGSIADRAFSHCTNLISVTIPNSVTNIGDWAFADCTRLTRVLFKGNAPLLGGPCVFAGAGSVSAYYVAGTTGWGQAFGGVPTALANPAITAQPLSQTVGPGGNAAFSVSATGYPEFSYQWRKNGAALAGATQPSFSIAGVRATDTGAYSVAVSNAFGRVISSNATLLVDSTKPTVAISTPTPGQRITNTPPVNITGKAADSGGVATVWYQLNGTGWQPATTANGWTNWSATVSPRAGTNTVMVYAADRAGNRSVTNSRSFVCVTFSPLTLGINGQGTVTPATLGGSLLEVGRSYTATASPGSGWLFANWTGTLAGLPSSSATLRFVMQPNTTLTANFVANPFIPVKGSYYGLFGQANRAQGSSGLFTLTLTPSGAYSGNLKCGASSYAISGQFDGAGKAHRTISRPGTNPWQLEMELLFADQVLIGTVSNGVSGGWVAGLEADRAVFNARTNPATQYTGKYTLVIPGRELAFLPQGFGYVTITVDAGGNAALAGSLADSTNFTQTVPVTQSGRFPVYAPLYGGRGSVWGWVDFDASQPSESLGGWLSWIRPPLPTSRFYPAGFTNEVTAVGSRYTPPATATDRVIALTNGIVAFWGYDLGAEVVNQITLTPSNRVINLSSNPLTLNLTLASGLFSGSVQIPGTTRTCAFKGALLQRDAHGYGYYLGTNRSGGVYLGPQN